MIRTPKQGLTGGKKAQNQYQHTVLFIRKSRVRLVKQISVCFQSIAGSSKYRKLCQYTSRRMYRILPGSSKRWSQLQLKRSLSMLLYPSSWRFCHIEVCTSFLGFTSPSQLQNGCQIFGYLANKIKQLKNPRIFGHISIEYL